MLLAKSELLEGCNSKNGEINVFLDCFQLILMGFLTTSLHKNSQNDVKLLETWWFWHILGKGTHIYSNQKHPDFHQKSPWTPMLQLSPVCNILKYDSRANLIGKHELFTIWQHTYNVEVNLQNESFANASLSTTKFDFKDRFCMLFFVIVIVIVSHNYFSNVYLLVLSKATG